MFSNSLRSTHTRRSIATEASREAATRKATGAPHTRRARLLGLRKAAALPSLALVAATAYCCIAAQGALAASSVFLCVPSTAGQALVSGGSSGTCGSGQTSVALPSSGSEQQTLISILPHIRFNASGVGGKPTIQLSGANVQVVSGSGSTNGPVNGEGNLIVGYAENPHGYAQSGSNDLIVGTDNGWNGSGELVGGTSNQVLGPEATAFGAFNIASASGQDAAVFGNNNTASGADSSVTGGSGNQAIGFESSVTGGASNKAIGTVSSVTGGEDNQASNLSVAGTVTGGENNTATATEASVSGGVDNAATDFYGSILGGCSNTTGTGSNPNGSNCSFTTDTPQASTVAGGADNNAAGSTSAVAAGYTNIATGFFGTLVGGGFHNTSSGASTSVLGGSQESLSGPNSESRVGPTLFTP